MKLYIIRHGETEWNVLGKLQGTSNIELSERGIEQAKIVADKLKDIKFDAVYSSDLHRAAQTAKIIAGRDDIIIDKRIRELSFGKLEGIDFSGKRQESYDDPEVEQLAKIFFEPEAYRPVADGESLEHLFDRLKNFFDDLIENNMHKTVLLVSHGAAIHAMLLLLKNRPLNEFWSVDIGNCSVSIIDYKDGKYKVIEEGREYVPSVNKYFIKE